MVRPSEAIYLRGENDLKQQFFTRFPPVIKEKPFGHPSSGVVYTPKDGTTEKGIFLLGLRVVWPDAKPSEVLKAVEDLRQKRLCTEEELERFQPYLMSVEYSPGYMADAIIFHENNPKYSVEEFYRFILAN